MNAINRLAKTIAAQTAEQIDATAESHKVNALRLQSLVVNALLEDSLSQLEQRLRLKAKAAKLGINPARIK
jgi:hypothetical protein